MQYFHSNVGRLLQQSSTAYLKTVRQAAATRESDVGEVPMQRVVIYLQRRTDLPQPLFFDWWLGQHRALAEQLPGLRQYIISLAALMSRRTF